MLERKRESSCTVGGNVNLIKPLWQTVRGFLKTLKIRLPYDPAILRLHIYPKKTITQKDTSTPVLTEALLKIAINGHLGRFHILAIVNNAAVNTGAFISL